MSVSIDPNDYVEAPEGVNSLQFSDPKRQAKFELGVCMAIHKWDELNTAVENSWGGPNSSEKRDWMSGIVIDLFNEKVVDIALIEETLLYAMVDEFDTEVDNDSALEIAALVFKLFHDVMLEKYDQIDEMYAKWEAKQSARGLSRGAQVVVASDPNNPSDDEDSDEDDDASASAPAPALVEDTEMHIDDEPQGPVIDDDGFEMVQKKGRRGGRR